MSKLKIRMNRRAVSPIIATLLLVAIAVAAAVVTYTWVMSMAANQSQQSQTGIKMDYVLFGNTTTSGDNSTGVLVAVRNTGTVPATIQTFLLLQGDSVIVSKSDVNVVVPAGQLKNIGFLHTGMGASWTELKSGGLALPTVDSTVNVPFNDSLSVNTAYVVRIVTSTGFTMEGTYYTPASWS